MKTDDLHADAIAMARLIVEEKIDKDTPNYDYVVAELLAEVLAGVKRKQMRCS